MSGEHEACYVYRTSTLQETVDNQRPAKRRKVSKPNPKNADQSSTSTQTPFSPLFDGTERPECVALRYATFKRIWKSQATRIEDVLATINSNTLNEVTAFVKSASENKYGVGRIPTGLINAGPNIASHRMLFEQIARRLRVETRAPVVVLTSEQAPNLKTALKNIIRDVLAQDASFSQQSDHIDDNHTFKKLNYDLQALHDRITTNRFDRIIIALQDSEAFESAQLTDLITLLSAWQSRIPFVLLFGLATSVDLFHEKLPRMAIRCLKGESFDVINADEIIAKVFEAGLVSEHVPLRLGSTISQMLWERQHEHVQSVEAFCNAVKYAYMSHFYANPLSVITASTIRFDDLQPEHLEAIRNLPSFRRYIEEQLSLRETQLAKAVLDDDNALFSRIEDFRTKFQNALRGLINSIHLLNKGQAAISSRSQKPLAELYISAFRGELRQSVMLRDFLLSVKKMASNELASFMTSFLPVVDDEPLKSQLLEIRDNLADLLKGISGSSEPLRSEHDIRRQTHRTTVVAQKVELSKHNAALSREDSAYSTLVNLLHGTLQRLFEENLIDPQSLPLHEIFLYDLRSPHRDVFTPRPRFTVERALSNPHDFLGCRCCGTSLGPSQPTTTILYQLFLESGAYINLFDLWSAFYAILGDENAERGEDERKILALFYRSLAELKYLAMVKHSKRKTDHVAKLSWWGL